MMAFGLNRPGMPFGPVMGGGGAFTGSPARIPVTGLDPASILPVQPITGQTDQRITQGASSYV